MYELNVRQGDIFETNMAYIVNPVNIMGVMGAGLAKEVKKRHPCVFKHYQLLCVHNKQLWKESKGNLSFFNRKKKKLDAITLDMGKVIIKELPIDKKRKYVGVISLPTKFHWKDQSKMKDIRNSMWYINDIYKDRIITSVAVPLLGTGLGGLDYKKVIQELLTIMNQWGIPYNELVVQTDEEYKYATKVLKTLNKSK